jgi:ABC-type branched-subunit amino acid transport system substrate-binding protein
MIILISALWAVDDVREMREESWWVSTTIHGNCMAIAALKMAVTAWKSCKNVISVAASQDK